MTGFLQKIQSMVQMLLISTIAKEREVPSSIGYTYTHPPMAFDQCCRFHQICYNTVNCFVSTKTSKSHSLKVVL